jgi:CheY-like chemotaxis protein
MTLSPLILVVDDNRDAADSLACLLSTADYRVQTAYGGREALELAEKSPPDAVVLDIVMPRLTGYETVRALVRQSGSKRPLLIALTGRGSEGDELRAALAGFDHYFTKPVAANELLGVLAGISSGGGAAATSSLRVLVVDDNRDWTDEMVAQLSEAGYWVRGAYDGREALDVASLFSPEIVILDARMPRMGGHDAARVFSRHPNATRPVLIGISAYPEERERAARTGFAHFIEKPVDAATLAELFPSAPA